LRPRRFWPRFTLRVLLVFVTLIGIGLGYWTHRAREQRRIVKHIRETSGDVAYDWQPHLTPQHGTVRSPVPAWLLDRLGEDFFHSVDRAYVGNEVDLAQVGRLTHLRSLQIGKSDLTDSELGHVIRLRRLKELIAHQDQLNPEYGGTTKITDRSLILLAEMPRLEQVLLDGDRFTAAGLAALAQSRSLKLVGLNYCDERMMKDAVEPFHRAGRVRYLVVRRRSGDGGQVTLVEEGSPIYHSSN
jgi:hypothetical protein